MTSFSHLFLHLSSLSFWLCRCRCVAHGDSCVHRGFIILFYLFLTYGLCWLSASFRQIWITRIFEMRKVSTEPSCCYFAHIRHPSLPSPLFLVVLHPSLSPSFLLVLSSPSMTSVKRTSFPASSLSTGTRRRASRKRAMWTVSTTEKCLDREV